jgi:hypothetical protein
MAIKSKKYHDYVFKNGKLIGAFDDMYKNSDEIPWHQDETIKDIFSELDILMGPEVIPSSDEISKHSGNWLWPWLCYGKNKERIF